MNGEIIELDGARSMARLAEFDRLEAEDHQAAWDGTLGRLHFQVFRAVVRRATPAECARVGMPGVRLYVVTCTDNKESSGGLSRYIAQHRPRDLPAELGSIAFLQELEPVGVPLSIYDLPKRGRS